MTNETTASQTTTCGACGANEGERCRTMSDDRCDAGKHVSSQPKSIGDNAQFMRLLTDVETAPRYSKALSEASAALIAAIDSRAPAAQASATIQAAPELVQASRKLIHHLDARTGRPVEFTYSDPLIFAIRTALVAIESATIQEPVMVAEPIGEKACYCGGWDDVHQQGCPEDAAPMVADPAGVAVDAKFWPHGPTQIACSSCGLTAGESRVLDALKRGEMAATVKAVPSEALELAGMVVKATFGDHKILVPRVDLSGKGIGTLVYFAAPLAGKTGGGE